VLQHWQEDTASFGQPVIQVIPSPAVASLGKFEAVDPPGVNLGEVWDLSSAPLEQMPTDDATCPILVSSGGFSRAIQPPTIANFLSITAPLFVPCGNKVTGTVSFFLGSHLCKPSACRRFCSPPIGAFWNPKDLTNVNTMIKSIKALSHTVVSPHAAFVSVLELLGARLHAWLQHATTHPLQFACQAFRFAMIACQFPCLVTGAVPASTLCVTAFGPLMDMRSLCAWRLLLDSIPSSLAAKEDILRSRMSAPEHLSQACASLRACSEHGVSFHRAWRMADSFC
jgi:hypothetical protein